MWIRYLRIIIGSFLLTYGGWLLINNMEVSSGIVPSQILLFWVLGLGAFIMVMGFFDICIPKGRIVQSLTGLMLIYTGYYFFKDVPSANIYLWDIVRILGAWMVVAGIFWWCITPKCKKQQQDSKVQIIEV